MLSKVKKIFFTGAFGVLYLSFLAQLVYVTTLLFVELDKAMFLLGCLAVEWLVLITARYLSKKSAGGNRDYHNNNRRH